MAKYNVKCPYCGYMNKNLYLAETAGWMECIQCGSDVFIGKNMKLADHKLYDKSFQLDAEMDDYQADDMLEALSIR